MRETEGWWMRAIGALPVVLLLVTLAWALLSAASRVSWGPEPAIVWLVDIALALFIVAAIAAAPHLLRAVLITSGVIGLFAIIVGWAPEWHWLPALLRQQATDLRDYMSHVSSLRTRTVGWDWERLRLAATVWVIVEGLGLWSVRNVSIPVVTALPAIGLIGLAFFQYAALGGGQPVWAIEHIVIHLLELADLKAADIAAFRQFLHDHFAGRSYHDPSLQAQMLLFAVALTLSMAIRWVESLPERIDQLLS